jgi:methionyl aminopeptidase
VAGLPSPPAGPAALGLPAKEVLEALREAGRIAAAARDLGAGLIVPGAGLREVCEAVEDEIRRRGAGLAFPVQTSVNDVAAHDCPGLDDTRVYAAGDLAKLDVGAHLDGYVVDTATTVALGARPEERRLVDATRAALDAAIAAAGAGVPIWKVSAAIAATLRGFGARPMRNLCGHHVGRFTVHCPPPVPNLPEDADGRLLAGAVLAIEPFATEGAGRVAERGEPEVFRVPAEADPAVAGDPEVAAVIAERRGLPFARRDFRDVPRPRLEEALARLRGRGMLHAYAPLVETSGHKVAQAEHTICVLEGEVIVLTR